MIHAIAEKLRASAGIAAKADIAGVVQRLGLPDASGIRVGDDCAAIPDGNGGFLLLAIEGFINAFVAADPWFAGWCGVMVNVSDIAAMGGRPIAVVDAIWGAGHDGGLLAGLRAASDCFAVPLVGGHTNLRTDRAQLSVAILGRATKLLTSFDALPGQRLIAAIDLRGRYRDPYPNWDAATDAPAQRLRNNLEILPIIAESGLSAAAKDISQGGIIGTAMLLAECSGTGLDIAIDTIPRPPDVALEKWLQTFPSFGYLLSVTPQDTPEVIARFTEQGIAAADIGTVTQGGLIRLTTVTESVTESVTVWDLTTTPLIGCAHA